MRKTVLLLAVFGLAGSLWAADPFVGTWELNLAKCIITEPSATPKNELVKIEGLDNGLKVAVDGVDAQGKAYHIAWSAKYDGKDYPVTGDPNVEMTSLKKVDASTLAGEDKKAGKTVAGYRVIVSKDGKTMTLMGRATKPTGQQYNFNLVYDRK
jgi:hypothetical protein